jgi:hypothetical protein
MGGGLLVVILLSAGLLRARPGECGRLQNKNVGVHRCQSCHQKETRIWKQSAHAKAFEHLSPKDRRNPACLKCHTTGTALHLQGVQCESCHGGGRDYVRKEIHVDPKLARIAGLKVIRGAAGCKTCHTNVSPKLRRFHYRSMWKKIRHGKGQ